MFGFVVQGPKSNHRDSSGLKNRIYPFMPSSKVNMAKGSQETARWRKPADLYSALEGFFFNDLH